MKYFFKDCICWKVLTVNFIFYYILKEVILLILKPVCLNVYQWDMMYSHIILTFENKIYCFKINIDKWYIFMKYFFKIAFVEKFILVKMYISEIWGYSPIILTFINKNLAKLSLIKWNVKLIEKCLNYSKLRKKWSAGKILNYILFNRRKTVYLTFYF